MIPRISGAFPGRFSAPSLRASSTDTPRRVNHGGAAWLKRPADQLRQPQDGALSKAVGVEQGDERQTLSDAKITGTTRSLGSRLLGLNVAARTLAASAGQTMLRPRLPKPLSPKAAL